ncbi:endonuclease/exonuclease/phosphatase family protein [Nocardia brasiliensis]|uniref:endonuclease/exonuclease/phosphatase family protein n=1 Tax=Nocardia brasiliensis TaxID=37326 RepID=UPI00366B235D
MTVKVDFGEMQKLITEVRRAQSSLDAGLKAFSNGAAKPPMEPGHTTTFGNTGAGASCLSAHAQASEVMRTVLTAFSGAVESDAGRLAMALVLYRQMDVASADNLLQLNRNALDVFSTHLMVGGAGKDAQQAAQINRLLGLAGGPSQGNTVVAGDFNAQSGGNSPSAQGIRNFAGQGFDVDTGKIYDGRGGTSQSNLPIDHVLPRGVGSSEATRWERGESDHDGQVVDLTMPNW